MSCPMLLSPFYYFFPRDLANWSSPESGGELPGSSFPHTQQASQMTLTSCASLVHILVYYYKNCNLHSTYVHVYIPVHMWPNLSFHIYTCKSRAHMYTFTTINTCTHMYIFVHTSIHVHICTNIYIDAHLYRPMFIHVHTWTCAPTSGIIF